MKVSVRTQYDSGRANLVDCIRSGLALTGESSAQVIEFHLATKFGVKMEDVPASPAGFIGGLLSVFGEGAKPMLLSIKRELLLCSQDGVELSPLMDAVTSALQAKPGPALYLGRREAGQVAESLPIAGGIRKKGV